MDLASIAAFPPRDRLPAYLALLPSLLADPLPGLPALVAHLVADPSVSLLVGRQVLAHIVDGLRPGGDDRAPPISSDVRRQVLERALASVGAHAGNYDEQVSQLKLQLAALYEQDEDFAAAAKVLMAVPLESNNVKMADADKLKHLVHIVRLLIEVGDDGQAQTFFHRASALLHTCEDEGTRLAYQLCNARLLDFARKFNEAALRYHELSWNGALAEEDRLMALSAGVTCAILAPAGPLRTRLLASLAADERTAALAHETVLRKMLLDAVLRPAEVARFAQGLQAHQVARLPAVKGVVRDDDEDEDEDEGEGGMQVDGGGRSDRLGPETVLDRAVMEHNLLSCSKLYVNITYAGLGALLGLAPAGAEALARRMIEQERLRGWIDQIDKLIWFENRDADEAQATAGGLGELEQRPLDYQAAGATARWDGRIGRVADKVEAIADLIKQRELLAPVA